MNVFCGVPVWKERVSGGTGDDAYNLHFGEVSGELFKQYSEDGDDEDIFNHEYSFFTYDITKDGVDTFEYPFTTKVSPEKGVLSNWWAGCEPVCDMIRKITQDGFFFGMPWNQALGHLARKDRPLIVFVFTNEFDNAYSRVYTETAANNFG